MFKTSWSQLQEIEVRPGNRRRAVSGLMMGLNSIIWEHPTGVSSHNHPDSEQGIIVVEGRMRWYIDGEEVLLEAGDVAIIPKGIEHRGETVGENAHFYEILSPASMHTLPGFLGALPH